MAVPADIRAVKRPVNTIVDDSGRDGPKRYAVRERSGAKYVQGGNPQPRNGKVIGHIIDHAYVPLEEKAEPIVPDMLSYGASALVCCSESHCPGFLCIGWSNTIVLFSIPSLGFLMVNSL